MSLNLIRLSVSRVLRPIAYGSFVAAVGGCASTPVSATPEGSTTEVVVLGEHTATIAPSARLVVSCDVPASAIVAATAPSAFDGDFASDRALAWSYRAFDGQDALGQVGQGAAGPIHYTPNHPGVVVLTWANDGDAALNIKVRFSELPAGADCHWGR